MPDIGKMAGCFLFIEVLVGVTGLAHYLKNCIPNNLLNVFVGTILFKFYTVVNNVSAGYAA